MKKGTFTYTAVRAAPYILAIAVVVLCAWFRAFTTGFAPGMVLVFVASAFSEAVRDKNLDEVELAADRFGAQWGAFTGIAFVSVLIWLPSFQSLLLDLADWWIASPDSVAVPMPVGMFIWGMLATMILQQIARSLVTLAWKRSKQ